MKREDKLRLIISECTRNLEKSRNRTPGEWKAGRTSYNVPAIFPHDGNRSLALFGNYRQGEETLELTNCRNNSAFIEACSEAAELGWESTIIAAKGMIAEISGFTFPEEDRPETTSSVDLLIEKWSEIIKFTD